MRIPMSITGERYEPRDRELALWLRRVREEMEVEYSVYMRPIVLNRSVSIYIIRLGHDKCEVHQITGPETNTCSGSWDHRDP